MSNYPTEPLEPKFSSNMSPHECAEMRKAHRWAYRAIVGVIDRFSVDEWPNYDHIDMTNRRSVDQSWRERQARVKRTFLLMGEAMASRSIAYQKQGNGGCTNGMLGNTLLGQSGPINLCDDLFNDDWLRFTYWSRADWVRALSVVHEMSHSVSGGTIDVDDTYSYAGCGWLAYLHPDKAVQNAQNYAYFAMEGCRWAPGEEDPDMGIWTPHEVGGKGPAASHAPAATMIIEDVLLLAYREPEAMVGVRTEGGPLWFKTLDLHGGRAVWTDASPIKAPDHLRSVSAPALAVSDEFHIHCAYVDDRSRLMLTSAGTGWSSSQSPGLSPYHVGYGNAPHWSDAKELVSDASQDHAPAIAVFTGGQSTGIYTVHVDKWGALHCLAWFREEGFAKLKKLASGWTPIDFDKPRKASSAPALVIHEGVMKCLFRDEQGHWVTLNYQPVPQRGSVRDVKPGSWHEAAERFDAGMSTVALASWTTGKQPALMAVGRGVGDDRTMRYCVSSPQGWNRAFRTHACRTSYGSALLSYRGVLHLFHQRDGGTIDWLTANNPA